MCLEYLVPKIKKMLKENDEVMPKAKADNLKGLALANLSLKINDSNR